MFFRRPQYFPKQLFSRFLIQQILGVVPTLLVAALLTRLFLESKRPQFTTVEEAVHSYDQAFLFLALVMAITISGISLWTGYRLVFPLGRVLVRARSILKRDYSSEANEDPLLATEDEHGEWSDLESALQRIGRDMEKKDQSLSKEREETETIIGALTEAVVAVDVQGNILFFNSQFAVLFGKQDRARLYDYFRNPDILGAFRTTLKEGKNSSISTQLRSKNESNFKHFSLSVAPLKLRDGTLYGAVGVFHDVTELKRMDQIRVDFVANVSHELRTPLTSIKGYAQVLKDELPHDEQKIKFLRAIERNTDRLIALVNDLLNISSLESGSDLEKEKVLLAPLTDRVAQSLESLRKEKNHSLQHMVNVKQLHADPKRIEQVLFNLLENAIKYTPAGGKIELRWDETAGETILSVADSGPGISPEHQSRIFERFYRVDSGRARDQGGTGLGLAIVKHIVQRHGGKVRLESSSKGSTFYCNFPIDTPLEL